MLHFGLCHEAWVVTTTQLPEGHHLCRPLVGLAQYTEYQFIIGESHVQYNMQVNSLQSMMHTYGHHGLCSTQAGCR